jgi:flagellar assembly factor FliW
LKIETTRFGTLDVEEDQIIHVASGLIGFPDDKRYVLMKHQENSPFFWFQSLDHGALAFVLTDPLLSESDYEIDLSPEDIAALELENGGGDMQGVQPMVIVNIPRSAPREMTMNLLGPVIFNLSRKVAKQIVLYQSSYSHRHPVLLAQQK